MYPRPFQQGACQMRKDGGGGVFCGPSAIRAATCCRSAASPRRVGGNSDVRGGGGVRVADLARGLQRLGEPRRRSEEHTSDLPSLPHLSYAGLYVKKTKI